MEHLIVQGGVEFLPFARSRAKALKASGRPYASQKFEVNGVSIQVRVTPGHEYVTLSANSGEVYIYPCWSRHRATLNGFFPTPVLGPWDTDDSDGSSDLPAMALIGLAARARQIESLIREYGAGMKNPAVRAGVTPPRIAPATRLALPYPVTTTGTAYSGAGDDYTETYEYEFKTYAAVAGGEDAVREATGAVVFHDAPGDSGNVFGKFAAAGFLPASNASLSDSYFPLGEKAYSFGTLITGESGPDGIFETSPNGDTPLPSSENKLSLAYETLPEYLAWLKGPTEPGDASDVLQDDRYLRAGLQVTLVFFEYLAVDSRNGAQSWLPDAALLNTADVQGYGFGGTSPYSGVSKGRVRAVITQKLSGAMDWSDPITAAPPADGYEPFDFVADPESPPMWYGPNWVEFCPPYFAIFKNWNFATLAHDGFMGDEIKAALGGLDATPPPSIPGFAGDGAHINTSNDWLKWLAAKALKAAGAL